MKTLTLIGGMFHKWQRKRLEKRVRELEQDK